MALAAASARGWGPAGTAVLRRKQIRVRTCGITLWCHRDIATLTGLLVQELVRAGYPVVGGTPDDWGFASRKKRPPAQGWSNHAWGLGVDLNALRNPMRRRGLPRRTQFDPVRVRAIAAKYGFRWGGDWRTPDPMHFEFVGTPAHARALVLRHTARQTPTASRPAQRPAPARQVRVLRLTRPFMRGTDVVQLQRALVAVRIPCGVDGTFGPGTRAAVIRFQQSRQLTADGIYGPASRAALRKAIGA